MRYCADCRYYDEGEHWWCRDECHLEVDRCHECFHFCPANGEEAFLWDVDKCHYYKYNSKECSCIDNRRFYRPNLLGVHKHDNACSYFEDYRCCGLCRYFKHKNEEGAFVGGNIGFCDQRKLIVERSQDACCSEFLLTRHEYWKRTLKYEG